jgi:hypothetical protein
MKYGPLPLVTAAFLALAPGAAPRAAGPDFDREVAPLLAERCLECHSGDKPRGGLDLSRRRTALAGGDQGPVLVPGKPDESLLWEYVSGNKMPPKKPLNGSEKALLRAWVAAGAPWGAEPVDLFRVTTAKRAGYDWWSLRPVARRRPPPVRDAHWCRNPIDAFLLQKLEAHGLRPAAPADRRTLIRRLSFDLLGLPPAPEEVAAFEQDGSPAAYEALVERYLGSPQYGERWARHWLDVTRFGESNGFEFDEPRPNAWPYRDWVVSALNRDLPYDEFARLQLAGDVLRPGDPEAVRATGFLTAGAYDSVGQTQQSAAMRKVVRQDELEDLAGTVGQAFLGLTVHCARCHDHKFDPVRQAEYYRLTAALGGVRHGERPLPGEEERLARTRRRLAELEEQQEAVERPVREQVLAERRAAAPPPRPLARWDFTAGPRDELGGLDATLHGGARLAGGLRVDGKTGYAATVPLKADLRAKTLEAWVSLDNLRQQGGAAVGVQVRGRQVFDAIVFAEIDPGRWMAGSEGFVRTRSFGGSAETEADRPPVHVAVVYAEDGMITGYRDGRPYGAPYKTSGPRAFKAGESEVVFGLRHSPPGGNRMLAGVIRRAQLYDRALSPAEVAASAAAGDVGPDVIAARLPEGRRAPYVELLAAVRAQRELLARLPAKAYAVMPRQPEVAHVLLRGDPARPAAVVTAGGVRAVAGPGADFGLPPDAPEAECRRRLAAWVTDPKNPLFARVIVNRLWHHHFGVGLVDTPNDFGFNGGRPSHPELLDWLAAELAAGGWRLKHLHRLIVTSAAYRQGAAWGAKAARVDAGNRLLWRKAPRRLEAEAVRDAALCVAGRLNLRMGGPGFQDLRQVRAPGTNAVLYLPADGDGEGLRRRSLYRVWSRGGRDRLLDAFDCPDPSATAPSRAVTTTPLQALAMLNNALILRTARDFAGRLEREAGGDVGRQVRRAYLLAYGRPPNAEEADLAARVVRAHGLAVLTRAIFNSNEFLYVD